MRRRRGGLPAQVRPAPVFCNAIGHHDSKTRKDKNRALWGPGSSGNDDNLPFASRFPIPDFPYHLPNRSESLTSPTIGQKHARSIPIMGK